jgi:tRNA-splicing ligase RtcB
MAEKITRADIVQVNESVYEIPQTYRSDMRVPARFFANERMLNDILADRALWQLVNVATLPGIQKYAFAMPDIHQGYGFPIGGVAGCAIAESGVISPGGIGYDINCGVRLMVANISVKDIRPYLEELATDLFHAIPSGVGRGGNLTFNAQELDKVLHGGAQRMLTLDYGTEHDIEVCEENGRMTNADPDLISEHAKNRGADQLGTLGSGNHFLEVQYVDKIFDTTAADAFGLAEGAVTVMIHCGSRGLGHQTCTDYVRTMMHKLPEWGYTLADRELVYAPFESPEAQNYFKAMAAASNYAWANRHMIGHWVRTAWQKRLGSSAELSTLYDVSHNIGKVEKHRVDGIEKELIMHRKGATRAFGPGRSEIPAAYRAVGQPVLIPGTMGTASYVLAGTEQSMNVAFGSSCHGAGRKLSRMKAKVQVEISTLRAQLESLGIIIRSDSDPGLAEEAPEAYKDVEDVIAAVDGAHLAQRVARLRPLAVIKGG